MLGHAVRAAGQDAAPPPQAIPRSTVGGQTTFAGRYLILVAAAIALCLLIFLPNTADAQCAPGPPPNDCFASAKTGSGEYSNTQSTIGATNEVSEQVPMTAADAVGATIWYSWTAPYAGTASVSLCGSDYNSVLAVWTGSAIGSLFLVTYNDDGCGGIGVPSQLSFTCAANTVYRIQVAGWSQSVGNARLTITGCTTPPPSRTDSDQDGVENDADNCPAINNNQDDLDRDGEGDPCDADRDGDEIANGVDNCPDLANPNQTDEDENGIGDVCEGADGSGTVETPPSQEVDSDLDSVPDNADNCPAAANRYQDDLDDDNIGDLCDSDLDGDGVSNEAIADDGIVATFTDNCPQVPNPDQLDSDGDGKGDACQFLAGWTPQKGGLPAPGSSAERAESKTMWFMAAITVGGAVLVAALVGLVVAMIRRKS